MPTFFADYSELLWLGVIFLLIFGLSFLLIYRLSLPGKASERLKPKEDLSASKPELILGELTPGLAEQVPMAEESRTDLKRDLMAAGFYRPTALVEYAAVRTVLTLLPLIVAGVVALFVDNSQLLTVLGAGIVLAMAGYSLPRLFLFLRARLRARAIERGLPVAVDMLTLCLSAGQNILAALQRVSTELKYSFPVLSDELEIVRQQAELRSLQHALQQFADRVPVPEFRNLSMILIQSERLGTDAASTLLEYSSNLRTTLRQRADAKANRTMFWMLFPTLLCLWIPAGIVLIGPAVLEFQSYRRGVLQQWRDARRELREVQGVGRPTSPSSTPPVNESPAPGQ
jgi:tight adherence protein C